MGLFDKKPTEAEVAAAAAEKAETERKAAEEKAALEAKAKAEADTTAAVPDANVAALTATVGDLVTQLQSQAATAQTPGEQPIKDISPEDYAAAIEEGGQAMATAMTTRHNADLERQERRFTTQIGELQGAGSAAINSATQRLVLQSDEYYKNDPKIKADVDAHLAKLGTGQIVTAENVESILIFVKGNHQERIIAEEKEKFTRQQRDTNQLTGGLPSGSETKPGGPPGEEAHVPTPTDLHPKADQALAALDDGKGRTADDFARSLPDMKFKDARTGEIIHKKYTGWDDMLTQKEEALEELARQHEGYYS